MTKGLLNTLYIAILGLLAMAAYHLYANKIFEANSISEAMALLFGLPMAHDKAGHFLDAKYGSVESPTQSSTEQEAAKP